MAETDQVTYVPAASGFEVLTYLPDDRTYTARPVVAWAVLADAEGFVRAFPLTPGEALSLNTDPVVLLPNGEVVSDDLEWATAGEWLAEMKSNDGKPLSHDRPPARGGVLALDAFRQKFKGGGDAV